MDLAHLGLSDLLFASPPALALPLDPLVAPAIIKYIWGLVLRPLPVVPPPHFLAQMGATVSIKALDNKWTVDSPKPFCRGIWGLFLAQRTLEPNSNQSTTSHCDPIGPTSHTGNDLEHP